MTTIIGIKTNVDEEAVVLASDTQVNYFDDKGDLVEKKYSLKIVYGDFWALAHAGSITNDLMSFFNKLKNPKDKRYKGFDEQKLLDIINNAIKEKRFMEVDKLNADVRLMNF